MKIIWGSSLLVILGLIVFSCLEAPQYSEIPNIEFEDIVFKDVQNGSSADSLILSVKFRDGDGNVGLDPSETNEPYNDKYYFRFPNGSYITYKTKRTDPNYDTLPDFVKPYNCTNWEVVSQNQKVVDTLYFELNPNHYNISITFQVKDALGNFNDFDWDSFYTYPLCEVIGFNGRFPILSKDLSQPSPLEGSIRYAMNSVGFNIIFSIKTLRLKVRILDRSLNSSNEIFTPEFTLQSIKK